jgi:integrase/recombinase XerD
MDLNKLFNQFVREKKYLLNVTKKTETWYWMSWKAFTRNVGTPEILDRFVLNEFVIKLRESGIQAKSCNTYICAINTFLSWLWENHHTSERLKIKYLKAEEKVIQTYTDAEMRAFVNWKPKTWTERRLYALLMTLIDTGARIDIELLRLKREDVDLDNLLIKLDGKGGKERYVPISLELRKVLHKWLDKHNKFDLVFPTRDGGKQIYRNCLKQFAALSKKLGIKGGFHKFRHTFATQYMRNGGSELYLQRALGHSSLAMTRRYTQINEEDLKRVHLKNSLLSRLK